MLNFCKLARIKLGQLKAKILTIIGFCLLCLSCHSQPSKNIQTIAPATYAEKINAIENAQLLDVRTPEEYKGEHLNKAVNVNWNDDQFVANVSKYDKSKPVFVYCKIGGRSLQAAQKLSELGFTEIYNLDGGILKWNAAGLSKPSDKTIGMSRKEYANLITSNQKVLVNFYAEWCAPCKTMQPYMLKLQKDLNEKVTVSRIDADAHKTLVSEMKIDELPVLILYENGQPIWQHKGFISEEDLKKQLK